MNKKITALDIIRSGKLGKYDGTMMLTPRDLQDIFQCCENVVYDYLRNDPPFRVEKVGGKVCIIATNFWAWYFGLDEVA